ncbi:LLM class flavin-dependent oxidoreductase [Dactylosporangium darangshiense]|uniref:LLM class flavin-dependent oxidoreductase n=1 Tax=Dactylosporangium darangshiense TaxID=579108 RepID=A0ABP8DDZ2_9ACTN
MSIPLHLALEVDAPSTATDIAALERAVAAAERAGVAFVTIDDHPGSPSIEAGVRASYLARRTTRIGLAPTLHVAATEPFHLATQLASLDHATLGRAAWVVGAARGAEALATVGRAPLGPEAVRRETADVIDVARRLWDSWEDDAVIRDVATGRFLDRDRVHHVGFEGATFSVIGPLITPRPPQGQVVVIGSDALGVTGRLDIALVGGDTVDDIGRRAVRARRHGAALAFAELTGLDDLELRLERLAGVVDGVRLHLPDLELVDRIPPALALAPAGATLRETLGLPRPANRYALARTA